MRSAGRGTGGIALTTPVVVGVMVPLCRVVVPGSRRGRRYLWLLAVGVLSSSVVNLVVKGPPDCSPPNLAGNSWTTTSPLWVLLFAFSFAPALPRKRSKIAPSFPVGCGDWSSTGSTRLGRDHLGYELGPR